MEFETTNPLLSNDISEHLNQSGTYIRLWASLGSSQRQQHAQSLLIHILCETTFIVLDTKRVFPLKTHHLSEQSSNLTFWRGEAKGGSPQKGLTIKNLLGAAFNCLFNGN